MLSSSVKLNVQFSRLLTDAHGWRGHVEGEEAGPPLDGTRFVTNSVALTSWRNITASVRRALVLAAILGLLLTGTEVRRWR
ncbi:MAG: hypothetical protein WAN20_04765 [Pseudonocardiaceae bacterium]